MRIKDIAEAAGVSTATVSRVLAKNPNVREETRDRVMIVIEQLHYTPNRAARSLRSKRSSFIGLLVADIQNPFFASVSRAVEDVALAHGYSVILCNTDEDPEKERMYLELMRNENAAGIILAPTGELSCQAPHDVFSSIPVVVIDRRIDGVSVDSVLVDNVAAARELTRHMLNHGYTRIAGLFGSLSTTGKDRQKGYCDAMHEAGLEVDDTLLVRLPARREEGHAAVTRLLEQANRPEAIIASNGLLAAGAFQAIRDKELPVPDAIAFAGFDEMLWTAMTRPAVTVVEQPIYAIGQTASELLLKRMAEPDRPVRQVLLETKLIVRQSCGRHEADFASIEKRKEEPLKI